jgi:hypothetical protein
MKNPIPIKSFPYRPNAEAAKTALNAHDIESNIDSGDMAGAYPLLTAGSGGVKLYVDERDADRAAEILTSKVKDERSLDEKIAERKKRKSSKMSQILGWILLLIMFIIPLTITIILMIIES